MGAGSALVQLWIGERRGRYGCRLSTTSQLCDENVSMLEMRQECERCTRGLTEDGPATICSYECTFCLSCAKEMGGVCPNCGGELTDRPRHTI